MKYEIKNRFTGKVQFTADICCRKSDSEHVKMGLSVKWAIKNGANLGGANLGGANLRGANLRDANLRDANLRCANLRDANLRDANLRDANLRCANLGGANLGGANLRDANLRDAYLGGANLRDANKLISFGPVGKEGRVGIACFHEKTIMVQLGCFWGTEKEAIEAVDSKYGEDSSYAKLIKASCDVLREKGVA